VTNGVDSSTCAKDESFIQQRCDSTTKTNNIVNNDHCVFNHWHIDNALCVRHDSYLAQRYVWYTIRVILRGTRGNAVYVGSPDKLRNTRSVAYSVEIVVLNKHQISGGRAYLDCYLRV